MANKGGSGYIKRLYAPKYFAIHKKEHKYVVRQDPGRHTMKKSVALSIIINKLNLAATRFEADKIIKGGLVSVNGKIIKEPKYPVGLNDIVTAGKESHMIGISDRGHILIAKKEKSQIYKIIGKYKSKENKIMIQLHDGRIMNATTAANINDSAVISNEKISKVLKLDSGSKCEIIDGVHVGMMGTIKEINKGNMHKEKSVIVEPASGEKFETLVRNIIIVE
jgi:small subunit ribosomal protein S4e